MITTNREIIDYMEHFGVKGMHWGVRKDRSSSKSTSEKTNASESKEKMSKSDKRKVALAVGIPVLVGGAAMAAAILTNNGQKIFSPKPSMLDHFHSEEAYAKARGIINDASIRRYEGIRSLERSGKITPLQSRRIRDVHTRQYISGLNRAYKDFLKNKP